LARSPKRKSCARSLLPRKAKSRKPRVVVDISVLMAGIFELQEPFLCRVGIQPVSTSGRKIGNHLIRFTRKQALFRLERISQLCCGGLEGCGFLGDEIEAVLSRLTRELGELRAGGGRIFAEFELAEG